MTRELPIRTRGSEAVSPVIQNPGYAIPAPSLLEKIGIVLNRLRIFNRNRPEYSWIQAAWSNLPEIYEYEPWAASPDSLRKYAMIECGYADVETFYCTSEPAALDQAKRLLEQSTEYRLIETEGSVVRFYKAQEDYADTKSPEDRRMQEDRVFNYVASLMGTTPKQLQAMVGKSR